ncbi:MAG: DNA translocase FtsK 4TM domain-containing protein [Anaerolineae bacterium]|nr:DNA translocase FtsK 4TM domain-containing protein [Anaerolineae bacterium]
MAKRTKAGKTQDEQVQPVPPRLAAWTRSMYQRGILGVFLVCLAILTLLGLLQEQSGFLVDWWSDLLRQAFGWGSFAIVVVVAASGVLILLGKMPNRKQIPWHTVIGVEIAFLALLGVSHLFAGGPEPWQTAQAGGGGGYVGAALSTVLRDAAGTGFALLVLALVLLGGAILASGLTVDEWVIWLEDQAYKAQSWAAHLLMGAKSTGDGHAVAASEPQATSHSAPQAAQELAAQEPAAQGPPASAQGGARDVGPTIPRPRHTRRYNVALPPLGLLDPPSETATDAADVQHKKRTIEVTLSQFGVPAEVVEINPGPMVTQFGVEPGYVTRTEADGEEKAHRVRVARIASLNNDLALALAAAPIRIEAPIPGRSLVGIEVPNSQVSLVSLRKVMSSSELREAKSHMMLGLGEGVSGRPVVADLSKMPHLLIAGTTGSGKSVCLNTVAVSLLFQNSPLTLRMVMIDPKRVELHAYNALPHLYGKVESDVERIVGVLHWLVNEMQERYRRFAQVGARHLEDYNRRWQVGSSEYLPRIVTIIDEMADLMLFAPEEVEKSICRLAQMARATGMHLVLATQRPSVDVVTGLIKANFPARIGFTVSSGTDSRVILDTVGAETLLGRGDMLFMSPDSSGLKRAQGCFVSQNEIARVVRYWQEWATREGWERVPSPWEDLLAREEAFAGDELLDQALEIVREQGNASASLLQRRMHIGYPRAARLIDDLERLGIIGPAETGGRPRRLLDTPRFEAETSAEQSAGE